MFEHNQEPAMILTFNAHHGKQVMESNGDQIKDYRIRNGYDSSKKFDNYNPVTQRHLIFFDGAAHAEWVRVASHVAVR